jgi:hypothetical protein
LAIVVCVMWAWRIESQTLLKRLVTPNDMVRDITFLPLDDACLYHKETFVIGGVCHQGFNYWEYNVLWSFLI